MTARRSPATAAQASGYVPRSIYPPCSHLSPVELRSAASLGQAVHALVWLPDDGDGMGYLHTFACGREVEAADYGVAGEERAWVNCAGCMAAVEAPRP